jgi:hypothetical protein
MDRQGWLVLHTVLRWAFNEIISPYETTLIYFRKNFNEINCYTPQRMVTINVREIKGVVWDGANNFFRSPPEHNSFCSGELCFRHRLLVDFFEDFRRDIERFIPVWKIRPGIIM